MELSCDNESASLLLPTRSLANELFESTKHSLIQSPINAVAQIVDQSSGAKILPSVQIFDAPAPQEFSLSNPRWYAQQFGNALGMTAHFCLLNKFAPGRALQAGEQLALADGVRMVGRSALLGGLYSAVFVPTVESEKDFWTARGRAGVAGALSFATLTASSLSLRAGADKLTWVSGRDYLKHEIVAGGLAGIPAGLVSADANALLAGKGFATSTPRLESMYGFAVVGAGLGLVHTVEQNVGRNHQLESSKVSERGSEDTAVVEQASRSPDLVQKALQTAGLEKVDGSYAASVENLMPAPDWSTKGPAESVVKALSVLERTIGGEHADVRATIDALMSKHHLTGSDHSRHMQPVIETLIRARAKQFGAESSEAADAEVMLGKHHEYHGQWTEAVNAMARAADIRCRVFGPESVERAQALAWEGNIQTHVKNYAAAEAPLRNALEIFEKRGLASRNADAADVMASLAEVLLHSNRRSEASAFVLRTIDGAGRLPDSRITLYKAVKMLADIHLYEGKVADAMTLYERADTIDRSRTRVITSADREMSKLSGDRTVWDEIDRNYNPYLDAFDQVTSTSWKSFTHPRQVLVEKFSWSVPNEAALQKIASLGPLVEVGAGAGYWSALLRARGVDLLVYDAHPVESRRSWFHSTAERSWTNVAEGTENVAANHADRTLFLSWPPHNEPMGANTLWHFTGNRLVYVGEGRGGVTGDVRFHDMLEANWNLVETVAIPQWKGRSDALYVYERKN